MDWVYTAVFAGMAIYAGVRGAPWWLVAFAGFASGMLLAAVLFDKGLLVTLRRDITRK